MGVADTGSHKLIRTITFTDKHFGGPLFYSRPAPSLRKSPFSRGADTSAATTTPPHYRKRLTIPLQEREASQRFGVS